MTETADVETRLGRGLTDSELTRVPGLLEEASALVQGYVGAAYPNPVTNVVRVVESRIVARALAIQLPAGVQSRQESAGQMSQQVTMSADASSGGVWLSKVEKKMLAALRPSMVSAPLQSERYS